MFCSVAHARTCRESPKTAPFTLKIIPLELAALRRKETDYDLLLRHLRTTYAKSHSNREKYRARTCAFSFDLCRQRRGRTVLILYLAPHPTHPPPLRGMYI